jgi:hypothetical protein
LPDANVSQKVEQASCARDGKAHQREPTAYRDQVNNNFRALPRRKKKTRPFDGRIEEAAIGCNLIKGAPIGEAEVEPPCIGGI